MRARLAFFLVALLSAGPAFGECTWILWQEESSWSKLNEGAAPTWQVGWHVDEAFPNMKECRAAVMPRLRRWASNMEAGDRYDVSVDDDRIVGKATQRRRAPKESADKYIAELLRNLQSGIVVEFKCLPDTIDPRERK